ncbi:MAG: hypothetical protein AAFZ17_00690 [Cyanobacteria bacterium J06650_10]
MPTVDLTGGWQQAITIAQESAQEAWQQLERQGIDLELLTVPEEALDALGPKTYRAVGQTLMQLSQALRSLAALDEAIAEAEQRSLSVEQRFQIAVEWLSQMSFETLPDWLRTDPGTAVLEPDAVRVPTEMLRAFVDHQGAGRRDISVAELQALPTAIQANLLWSSWLWTSRRQPLTPLQALTRPSSDDSEYDAWAEACLEAISEQLMRQFPALNRRIKGFALEQLFLSERSWRIRNQRLTFQQVSAGREYRQDWLRFTQLAGTASILTTRRITSNWPKEIQERLLAAAQDSPPEQLAAQLIDGWESSPETIALFEEETRTPLHSEAEDVIVQIQGGVDFVQLTEELGAPLMWSLIETVWKLPEASILFPPSPLPTANTSTIGVLLPLRLETRWFRAGADWLLKLRVLPDAIALTRDDPNPQPSELDALDTVYDACEGDLAQPGDEGMAAWQSLVGSLGGGRAVWLVRNFPPLWTGDRWVADNRPSTFQESRSDNQMHGMPALLNIDAVIAGTPRRLGTLAPDLGAISTVTWPDSTEGSWLTSFQIAQSVGMAIEIPISAADATQIEVLSVCGLSSERPEALLTGLQNSGLLALLTPGAATNAVNGQPTAHDAISAEDWRQLAIADSQNDSTQQLSTALTGDSQQLGRTPGPDWDIETYSKPLVDALWPALWGHSLAHIWSLGDTSHELASWASKNLRPLGRYCALRAGSQPYGILPVTCLRSWQPDKQDPAIETGLIGWLSKGLDAFAQRAEQRGNVVGADSEKLVQLLGLLPQSHSYEWWSAVPVETLADMLAQVSGARSVLPLRSRLINWWDSAAERGFPGEGLSAKVAQRNLDSGQPHPIKLPLVIPDNLHSETPWQGALQTLLLNSVHDPERWLSDFRPTQFEWPNSLLFRLLIFSLNRSAADLILAEKTGLEALSRSTREGRLYRDAKQLNDNRFAPRPDTVAEQVYGRVRSGGEALTQLDPEVLELPLRHTLDAASHRLDAWIAGIAQRRLADLTTAGSDRRLGAYGWLDNPKPGNPGPTDGGLLVAPSDAQMRTAVVLKDRAMHEPTRWSMQLNSRQVRTADKLAESVRAGHPLQEAVGVAVESIVRKPDQVLTLRKQWPSRPHHDQRHPCDGLKVLENQVSIAGSLRLNAEQVAAMGELDKALDAYGDLLLAEAVFHLTNGRDQAASAAMEAAAGLARPPVLEVLETPVAGAGLLTTVMLALPSVSSVLPSDAASPTQLSDAAVSAWLASLVEPSDWNWLIRDDDGDNENSETIEVVTLTQLGLQVADAALLDQERLEIALKRQVSADFSADLGALQTIDANSPGWRAHRRVRAAIAAIAPSAALPNHIATNSTSVKADLVARLQALISRAKTDAGILKSATEMTSDVRRILLQWHLHATDELAVDGPTAEAQSSSTIAKLEAERRISAATALDDRIVDVEDIQKSEPSVEAVAGALSTLLCGDGRWPVLAQAILPAQIDGHTLKQDSSLDDTWLTQLGMVRANLGKLDSFQLESALSEAEPALKPWTTYPGDPWRKAAFTAVNPNTGRHDDAQLLVIYAGGNVTPGSAPIALAVIDSWSETIPAQQRSLSAAFGFNGPRSQAPQAVLLAVPADLNQPLANQLHDIVLETHQLIRCRAADPSVLKDFGAVLPLTTIPDGGTATIHYDPV